MKNIKNNIPIITEENEKEYWIEYKQTLSLQIREAFVVKYANLVNYAAQRMRTKIAKITIVDYDDLVGYGYIGLLDAIDKYNPDKEIKFTTYAVTRITGAIHDELRKIDNLPRSVRQEMKTIEKAREILEYKLERNAKPEEIAKSIGITIDEYDKIMRYALQGSVTSLNEVWYMGDDSDEVSIIDTLKSSDKTNPEYLAERGEIQKEIVKALKKLPEKEQQILILYHYEKITLKEIGKVLGVSESRVSQIHNKAMQDLRYMLSEIKKSLL